VAHDLVAQGEVRWCDFGNVAGSEQEGPRPVVVVQGDELNRSRLQTTLVASMTTQTRLAVLPGAVFIPSGTAGILRDSVVQMWALSTVNKWALGPVQGVVPSSTWKSMEKGMAQMMGRPT